jgi:hypothetical protein
MGEARKQTFERAIADGLEVGGGHPLAPGFARVERAGTVYRIVPSDGGRETQPAGSHFRDESGLPPIPDVMAQQDEPRASPGCTIGLPQCACRPNAILASARPAPGPGCSRAGRWVG